MKSLAHISTFERLTKKTGKKTQKTNASELGTPAAVMQKGGGVGGWWWGESVLSYWTSLHIAAKVASSHISGPCVEC